jgi:hypothetical protein
MSLVKFRFGTSLLLVVTAVFAGFLGGYRWGGVLRDREIYDATVISIAYDFKAFVPRGTMSEEMAVLRNLRDLVIHGIDQAKITLDNDVEFFHSNSSIVVTTTGKKHREIASIVQNLHLLLNELKNSRKNKT